MVTALAQQALCARCVQPRDNAAGEIDGRRAVDAGRINHLYDRQPQRFRKMIGEAASLVSPTLKARYVAALAADHRPGQWD